MATAPLDLRISVKGYNDIQKLVKSMKLLEKEVEDVNRSLPKTEKNTRKLGLTAKASAAAVDSLTAAFKKLAAGFALFTIARGIANIGNTAATAQAQIDKLGIALQGVLGDETKEALKQVSKAAKDFNIPLEAATRNFTQLSAAGVVNGNSIEELVTLYRGLAAATKATGGNAEDLNGVLRAATQVLSKGKVQAEELRGQIGDRLPGAFGLFAEATKRSTAELQQALEEGTVSAEEFVTDFGRFIKDKYEPAAKRIGDSPAEAGARLTKALEELNLAAGPLLASLGAKFQEFATRVVRILTPLAEYLKDFFGFLGTGDGAYAKALGNLAAIDKQIAIKEAAILNAANDRTRNALQSDLDSLERRRQKALQNVNKILANSPQAEVAASTPQAPIPIPIETTQANALKETAEAAKSITELLGFDWDQKIDLRVAEEMMMLAEKQETALKNGQFALYEKLETERKYLRALVEIEALEKAITKSKEKMAEYANDEVHLAKLKNRLLQFETLLEQRNIANIAAQKRDANQLLKTEVEAAEAFGQIVAEVKPLNKELTTTQELLRDSFGIVANGLTAGIQGLIQGTKELNDVLSDVLNNLANLFLKAGVSSLGAGLKIPGFADGGRPEPKRISIVGERGPELFVPDAPGTVLTSDQAFNAARNAMGSGESIVNSDSAFEANTAALGSTTSAAALRAERAALMSSESQAIDVRFEEVLINEMRFTTPEQTMEAVNAGVAQARAQVFSDMRNRPATRKQVGVR